MRTVPDSTVRIENEFRLTVFKNELIYSVRLVHYAAYIYLGVPAYHKPKLVYHISGRHLSHCRVQLGISRRIPVFSRFKTGFGGQKVNHFLPLFARDRTIYFLIYSERLLTTWSSSGCPTVPLEGEDIRPGDKQRE